MQPVQLNVDDEVKALGDAVRVLISDIKAGKSAMQDLEDSFPNLVAAVQGMGNLPADLKKVDNQVFLGKSILDAVEAAPPVPPAA